jgi:hypothetical protein
MSESYLNKVMSQPVIASIINNRLETALLVGFGVVQVGLAYTHLPGWPCPIKAVTGFPCPGCGLSQATSEILHGEWQASIKSHVFAPFFLAALVLMTIVLSLPEKQRALVVARVGKIERKTGVTALFLMCLLLYWGLRLVQII